MQTIDRKVARRNEGKLWSEDDEIYLEYFVFMKDAPLKDAAEFLGRTEISIREKLRKMRKKDQNIGLLVRRWTEKEEEFLKKYYILCLVKI